MTIMKNLPVKKPPKNQRERLVLLGLVELYLETGKPIGSNTLRENGFPHLSSATIRNYFEKLEQEGFLKQQHSSGGRIPTHLAYQLYATTHLKNPLITEKDKKLIKQRISKETREIISYLQQAAETISELTRCAVFLSAPRFDQDFVLDIKLISIDNHRCLCVLITDFSLVQTELLYTDKKLSSFTVKRIESFFRWKLTGLDRPNLSEQEEALATKFYSEVMLRHLVGNTHFTSEDVYKTGFSQLLAYEDFNDATMLAGGLGFFENKEALRSLLNQCSETGALNFWIGENVQGCCVIAIPYKINQTIVGSIAILGPSRVPYRKLFGILETVSETLSECLTKSVYKFKITFRKPAPGLLGMQPEQSTLALENKHGKR
jgi:heat-inducible transcriptional repressor